MADTTTQNIPTTDPALLAAQAKAGQAGVDAYNAAISTLQQARATAVNSAMTSAAARGLAGPEAGGDVGRMYDSRISQLQQASGGYQADMAARDRRLSDYNAAVTSARSLIPGQVAIATAPIKAQGEYDVWKIGAQGREAVDKINAQKDLVAAQIEAAKAAAARAGGGGRGGGGGSAPKVTGANAAAVIKDAANQLSAAYAGPAQEAAQTAPTRQQAQAATSAANLTGQSAAAGQGAAAPQARGGLGGLLAKFLAPVQTSLEGVAQSLPLSGQGPTAPIQDQLQRSTSILSHITRQPLIPANQYGRYTPTQFAALQQLRNFQPVRDDPSMAGLSPQQKASAALQQSLGVGPDFQFPGVIAPEGTPWAGHQVGTLESILAPLGINPLATSGTMQFPEQQAAAQSALEEARGIGTSAYQAAGQQGADLLRSSGAYNIPEADATSAVAKLGGTTYDDIAREQQGLDKNLAPGAMIQQIVKDRVAAADKARSEGRQDVTDQRTANVDEQKANALADEQKFAQDWNGADLNKVASAAGQNRDWVLSFLSDKTRFGNVQTLYGQAAKDFDPTWKPTKLNSYITDLVKTNMSGVDPAVRSQYVGVLRGLFSGALG